MEKNASHIRLRVEINFKNKTQTFTSKSGDSTKIYDYSLFLIRRLFLLFFLCK